MHCPRYWNGSECCEYVVTVSIGCAVKEWIVRARWWEEDIPVTWTHRMQDLYFFQDRLHVSISHLRGSAWIGPGMDADVAVEVAEGRGVSSWCYGVWWSIGTEVIISSDEDQISMEAPHDIVQKEVTMHFKFERMEKNVVYLRKWYDTMDWRVTVNQCLLKLNKVQGIIT